MRERGGSTRNRGRAVGLEMPRDGRIAGATKGAPRARNVERDGMPAACELHS